MPNKKISIEQAKFLGFILLDTKSWNIPLLLNNLKDNWQIEPIISSDNKTNDGLFEILTFDYDNCEIALMLTPVPVPNNEAEKIAQFNYMWQDAVSEVKKHCAHIIVTVKDKKNNSSLNRKIDIATLCVKIIGSFLDQGNVIGIYANGAVLEPTFYGVGLNLIAQRKLPILNLVWIGLYNTKDGVCAYTYGLKSFGKDELEITKSTQTLKDVHIMVLEIINHILINDITPETGDTLTYAPDKKVLVIKSDGIKVKGKSYKILE